MKEEKFNRRNKIFNIILICVAIILLIGVSFAAYVITLEGRRAHTINPGTITFSYTEPTNAYVLNNVTGMDDNSGKTLNKYFEFKITGTTNIDTVISYYIYITKETVANKTNLSNSDIKIYLTKVENNSEVAVLNPTLVSSLSSINGDDTKKKIYETDMNLTTSNSTIEHIYRLRAWVQEMASDVTENASGEQQVSVTEAIYKFKINVAS